MATLRNKPISRVKLSIVIFLLVFLIINTFTISVSAVGGLNAPRDDNGLDYAKYDDNRYALDYYQEEVFGDVIGACERMLNSICNGLWYLSRAVSNFTGSAVKEAYKLDFVKSFATQIGQNIQVVAGINSSGVGSDGLFGGFLPLIVFAVGLYVFYNGLIKHSTSKALSGLFNFVVVFLLGVAFISYAPNFIVQAADLSADVNTGVLKASSKIFFPEAENVDETEYIVNNLWNVQVKQPWLILEFGTADVADERIDNILSLEPDSDEREQAIKNDIIDNKNVAPLDLGSKFGTTLLVLIVNIIISVYVFLLAGMLIVSQFLFLVFASIMPFVFVFSMFPGMSNKLMKSAITLFNLLLTKSAISLVMTIAFSLSSLFFTLSQDTYYLLVAFLQIVCFVGIFKSMDKLLSFFGLDFSGIGGVGRAVLSSGRRLWYRGRRVVYRSKRMDRRIGNLGKNFRAKKSHEERDAKARRVEEEYGRSKTVPRSGTNKQTNKQMDTHANKSKKKKSNVSSPKNKRVQRVKHMPVNARHTNQKVISRLHGVSADKDMPEAKPNNQKNRARNQLKYREDVAEKQKNVGGQKKEVVRPDIERRRKAQQKNNNSVVRAEYQNQLNNNYPGNDTVTLNGQRMTSDDFRRQDKLVSRREKFEEKQQARNQEKQTRNKSVRRERKVKDDKK